MNVQPLKREFRIVRSLAFANAMRTGARPVDERQRDGRPGRYTVSGAFLQLPEGELTDDVDCDAEGERPGDWRRE